MNAKKCIQCARTFTFVEISGIDKYVNSIFFEVCCLFEENEVNIYIYFKGGIKSKVIVE